MDTSKIYRPVSTEYFPNIGTGNVEQDVCKLTDVTNKLKSKFICQKVSVLKHMSRNYAYVFLLKSTCLAKQIAGRKKMTGTYEIYMNHTAYLYMNHTAYLKFTKADFLYSIVIK
jgi:hypothetical protein